MDCTATSKDGHTCQQPWPHAWRAHQHTDSDGTVFAWVDHRLTISNYRSTLRVRIRHAA